MKSILKSPPNHRLVRPITEEEAKFIDIEQLRPLVREHGLP
ncbi:hypothetical protein ACQKGO_15420 [Corallococcus interemptor]